MKADGAARFGLVNAVVPKDQLMATARDWAERIAGGAPLTIQALKESLRAMEGKSMREGFDIIRSGTLPTYDKAIRSGDAKEGVRAFAEKRKANFEGKSEMAGVESSSLARSAGEDRGGGPKGCECRAATAPTPTLPRLRRGRE